MGEVALNRSIRTAVMVLVLVIAVMCGVAVIANAGIGMTAPAEVKAKNGDEGVLITWSAVEGADGYIIYREALEGGGKDKLAKIEADEGESFCDTEAKGGKEYNYTVKAYNGMRKSRKSEDSSITYLSKPVIKYATPGVDCVELVWHISHGADGYVVYKRVENKLVRLADIKGDAICAYNDTDVREGDINEYTVVAYKGDYRSTHEYEKSGAYVKAPHLIKAENLNRGIEISWKKTGSADEYIIYRKTDGEGNWTKLGSSDSSTYKDVAVKGGVKYIYTVRAKKDGLYSGYDRMGVSSCYIEAPKDLKSANYNNGISVSWKTSEGADKYNVYRKNGEGWKLLGVTDKNRYYDKDIQDNTTYTYTIKAKNSKGVLSAFDEVTECRAYTAPVNMLCESTSDGIRVVWALKDSATGYVVYKKLPGQSQWSVVKTLTNNKQNFTVDYDVKKGEEYTYTVRAVKGETQGSYIAGGFTLKHLPVSKLKAEPSPSGIKLSWTKSEAECKEYVLYKSTGKVDNWRKVGSFGPGVFSFVDSKPVYGDINKYKLTLKLAHGDEVDTQTASAYGIDPRRPMVALTYDDGPNTKATNRILDALERVGGRATFFIVGERLNEFSACIQRESALGCEIANHTYNHVMFNSADSATIKNQITKTNNQVRDMTGKAPTLARAPGGYTGSNPKEDVGMPLIQWSLDTMDWSSRNADAVVNKIKTNVKDGDIVLMHDLYDSTAEATEQIVPWLVSQGYQIVTVSELMAVKGIQMQPGEVYFDAKK